MSSTVEAQPYRPVLNARAIADLADRLGRVRLPANGTDWRHGVPANWIAELLADWRRFDADRLQDQLAARRCTTVRAVWPRGSARRWSRGAAPARTAPQTSTATCCCRRSPSTGRPERSLRRCCPIGPPDIRRVLSCHPTTRHRCRRRSASRRGTRAVPQAATSARRALLLGDRVGRACRRRPLPCRCRTRPARTHPKGPSVTARGLILPSLSSTGEVLLDQSGQVVGDLVRNPVADVREDL